MFEKVLFDLVTESTFIWGEHIDCTAIDSLS